MVPALVKFLTVYNDIRSSTDRRFLVLSSDGLHGTGAYICRIARNPKKSRVMQTVCWQIHGNDMGDTVDGTTLVARICTTGCVGSCRNTDTFKRPVIPRMNPCSNHTLLCQECMQSLTTSRAKSIP